MDGYIPRGRDAARNPENKINWPGPTGAEHRARNETWCCEATPPGRTSTINSTMNDIQVSYGRCGRRMFLVAFAGTHGIA